MCDVEPTEHCDVLVISTSARSGGVLWIPTDSVNRTAGVEQQPEAALDSCETHRPHDAPDILS